MNSGLPPGSSWISVKHGHTDELIKGNESVKRLMTSLPGAALWLLVSNTGLSYLNLVVRYTRSCGLLGRRTGYLPSRGIHSIKPMSIHLQGRTGFTVAFSFSLFILEYVCRYLWNQAVIDGCELSDMGSSVRTVSKHP